MRKLTREIAWSASTDAGNLSMKRAGRTIWNWRDWNAAFAEFDRLWPLSNEVQVTP